MNPAPAQRERTSIIGQGSPAARLFETLRKIIPEGRALSENEWQTRHYWILLLTWLHAVALPLFGLSQGFGAAQSFGEGALIAAAALLATPGRFSRALRAGAASLGLVTASAILVQFSGGYIEAHFHYFVVLAIISIYQDWISYLLAIVFVAAEHGLTGQFTPTAVYNHPEAFAHPWKWALIHAGFILVESAALLATWRTSERARAHADLLLSSAGEGIIGLNRDGIITFANPAAAKMTGYPLEVLAGQPVDRILPPDAGVAPSSFSAEKENSRAQRVVLRRDGTRFLADTVSNPIREHHRIVGAVVTLRDETDRIHTEEKLKGTLSLLSATIEATADGILVVDQNGKTVALFNDQFQKMWGIPDPLIQTIRETKDDRPLLAYVTKKLKEPELFLKKVLELYKQPDAEIFDVLELADGRYFERYSKPRRIGNESVGRVWSFRDITERRRASEALENEVKMLESFVYTISHDLKTPVVSMHGMASILKEECGPGLNEKAKHYIERILHNAGYMETLILDLLELSKAGRKRQMGKKAEAREVIEKILKIHEASFQAQKIQVVLQPDLPHFMLDHAELTQLFQNLITNAAKFMGDQPHPRIEIGGKNAGNGVTFFIKDNGIGIDPAYHEKIFDIFHRLHDLQVEGTGVGLAIVKKIIHSNHGTIRLESEKGAGAAFFFWLPQTESGPGS